LQLKDNLQSKKINVIQVILTIKKMDRIFLADTCRVLAGLVAILMVFTLFVINPAWANDSLLVQNNINYNFQENNPSNDVSTHHFLLKNSEPAVYYYSLQQNSVLRRRRSMLREQALGVGANLLGPTMGYASAYLQYSYGRVFQAEAGIDLSTVYTGINLYPQVFYRLEELSPYMGLMIGYSDPIKQNIVKGIYAYMPVGMRYLTTDDWYVCIEIAATTASTVKTAPLFLGIKLGYLFKRR